MAVEAGMSEELALSGDEFWFHVAARVSYCDEAPGDAGSKDCWQYDNAFRREDNGQVAMFSDIEHSKPAAVMSEDRLRCL
jgi:hypothetical protein